MKILVPQKEENCQANYARSPLCEDRFI